MAFSGPFWSLKLPLRPAVPPSVSVSPSFSHIKKCIELKRQDVILAVSSRDACKALLSHFAAIARPNTGAPMLILVFARLASAACDWIDDGDLRIELTQEGQLTRIEVLSDLGVGMRERVVPMTTLRVPLTELRAAIHRVPALVKPLTMHQETQRRLVLTATEHERKTSMPPPFVAIGEEAMMYPCPPSVPRFRT
jgi:hypothetical protein